MNVSNYLTANQLCRRYGVCRRTISRWVQQPDLGFPKPTLINRRRYWPAEDLDVWEAERQAHTGSRLLP